MSRALLLVVLFSVPGFATAADAWDAPPFSTPARELLEQATQVRRDRPADVVVLLDERIFVLDEQHRLTRTNRMIYRVDSPDGVERWAASSARWPSSSPSATA